MIRYKEEVYEDYKICPVTGEVFEISTGKTLKQKGQRYLWVGIAGQQMYVHRIMANTYLGYVTDDVHHIDENPHNNALSNLKYLTHSNHGRETMKNRTGEKSPMFGKTLSDEHKQKISKAMFGKTLSDEHKQKISDARIGEKNPMYGRTGENHPGFGCHWFNNGIENRFCIVCPVGFVKGRLSNK